MFSEWQNHAWMRTNALRKRMRKSRLPRIYIVILEWKKQTAVVFFCFFFLNLEVLLVLKGKKP